MGYVASFLYLLLPVLLSVAYLTLAERKVMALSQRRKGPNVVGFWGVLQPLSDGLKLFLKATVLPSNSNTLLFLFSPILTLSISFLGWAVIPFDLGLVLSDLDLGILYLLAVSSLGVYGIIFSGWSSNSKYAFLGALRSTAQMLSYEVGIGFILLSVALVGGSLNLSRLVLSQASIWYVVPLFPLAFLFFLSSLAETNRPPFDLPEAEAELVAGYFVEYSAFSFTAFFLGEYSNILLICSVSSLLFWGGWLPLFGFPGVLVFGLKVALHLFCFIWVRASFPRYRFDSLMRLG